MEQFILAIDSGGTLTRALLLDHAGRVHARKSVETRLISEEEGAMEHDPRELYQAVCDVTLGLLRENRLGEEQIAGL